MSRGTALPILKTCASPPGPSTASSARSTSPAAPLVGKLYSIERIAPLVERAKQRAKELDLKGTFRFGMEFADAVRLIVARKVDVLAIVTAERPLSGAPDAFRLALDRSQSVKVVLTA